MGLSQKTSLKNASLDRDTNNKLVNEENQRQDPLKGKKDKEKQKKHAVAL